MKETWGLQYSAARTGVWFTSTRIGKPFMRYLALLFLGVMSASTVGCGNPCDDEAGKTTCGYCDKDVATSSNSHAGKCRYCGAGTNCSGDVCGDALMCESKVNLYIPKSTFHNGSALKSSGTSTVPPVAQVTPLANSMTVGSTVHWTVRWNVNITVTALRFEVTQFNGYFELPVTADQSNTGTLDVPMVEAEAAPGESGCLGTMTCWKEAPAGTTTGDGTMALVGAGGDVGQSMGGIGLTWDIPSYSQSGSTGGGSSCPAAATCCTTSGGIQVVGITCPVGSCPSGTFVSRDATYNVDQCSCKC